MGDFIGGITDAVGITDSEGEKRALASADAATARTTKLSNEQIALAKDQLAFQKEQYEDWDNVYGSIQKNLGEYYNNLDPDKIVSLGLENQQREFQQVQKEIKRDFAQRGLSDSGAEIAITSSNRIDNARTRAEIRSGGERQVAEEQLGFLNIGLNQGVQKQSLIGNAASNVSDAFNTGVGTSSSSATSFLNRGTSIGARNQEGKSDLFGTAVGAASAIISDKRLKENITFIGLKNDHKIYSFNYKGKEQKYKGVMAQDVIKYMPEAVEINEVGYMSVNYNKLGLTMEAI